jgi:hypothetical protein
VRIGFSRMWGVGLARHYFLPTKAPSAW